MLDKNKVNSLRDFALSHLPETVALSKKLYLEHHDSRASLQAVATASTLLINSPLSTQVEKLAGRLLHLVGEHPDTHTEYLIDRAVGDKALGITLEDAARYAEQKKSLTEAALIETAQLLCEFSGVSLPLWMNTHKEQSAPEQSLTTPAPVPVAEVTASDEPSIPKNQRPDLLTPLIEKAQRGETDVFSAAVIWPKLCDMAECKTTPFIGKTESGLQWIDANDSPQFLTKDALGDRLRRQKKAAIERGKPR